MTTPTLDQLTEACERIARTMFDTTRTDTSMDVAVIVRVEYFAWLEPEKRWEARAVMCSSSPSPVMSGPSGASQWVALYNLFRVLHAWAAGGPVSLPADVVAIARALNLEGAST